MSKQRTTSSGSSTLGLLGILFVALKLTGVISWSWWWVTLPFWGGLVFFSSLALLAIGVYLFADHMEKRAIVKARSKKEIMQ